jgi:Adenylate and Guanylate cyclase catalytic domain
MYDRTNKTSICSVVFLDIIDYSKKSDAEQIEVKNQFNDLINQSLKGIAQNDRIILDTGDGAAIAMMGSPEDGMFVALTMRDGILKNNLHNPIPLYVRFGINLGPVRIVSDINGQPNIIGDGINVAQRIMSFSQPNQILVSRTYYEVTSRLTLEFSEMFDYSGIKHDKHVREHEVYSVRSHKDAAEKGNKPIAAKDDRRLTRRVAAPKTINLKYAALALPALITLIILIKAAVDTSLPTQAPIAVIPTAVASDNVKSNDTVLLLNEKVKNLALEEELKIKSEQVDLTKIELAKVKLTQKEASKQIEANKKSKQKELNKMPPEFMQTQAVNHPISPIKPMAASVRPTTSVTKTTGLAAEKNKIEKKSGWGAFKESVKKGGESKCSQVQISMNHCN